MALSRRSQVATDAPPLGQQLREHRLARHLTGAEVAREAGISAPYLAQIEKGLRHPSLATLSRLSAVLDAHHYAPVCPNCGQHMRPPA